MYLECCVKIAITGSSGFIGSALARFLARNQHQVFRFVRKPQAGKGEISWDPAAGKLDSSTLEDVDAVVHLAGESIAGGRWTAARKRSIRESRVQGTRLVAQSMAHLFEPPKLLISVSAVGYYGDRGAEELVESSDPGSGFLADLCREWEGATESASRRGIRVVIPRIGMVLSASGGALPLMLPVFRAGIGGRLGSGNQYMSWITLEDVVGIIHHAIGNDSLEGPINAVSPHAVTNRDFTRILAQVLSRPAFLALPSFAARIVFGEMAREVLLSGAHVLPSKILKSKYKFQFPELEGALRSIFKVPGTGPSREANSH
jgi:uncharacterized protein